MKITLVILTVMSALFVGCKTKDVSTKATDSGEVIQVDYSWWNPTNALARANDDILSGDIKIYYEGTIGPFPAGIKKEDRKLVEDYAPEMSGTGCVIYDMKLRKLQNEYGATYNQRILEWIKENK